MYRIQSGLTGKLRGVDHDFRFNRNRWRRRYRRHHFRDLPRGFVNFDPLTSDQVGSVGVLHIQIRRDPSDPSV